MAEQVYLDPIKLIYFKAKGLNVYTIKIRLSIGNLEITKKEVYVKKLFIYELAILMYIIKKSPACFICH